MVDVGNRGGVEAIRADFKRASQARSTQAQLHMGTLWRQCVSLEKDGAILLIKSSD
jgi:hypothetical protein